MVNPAPTENIVPAKLMRSLAASNLVDIRVHLLSGAGLVGQDATGTVRMSWPEGMVNVSAVVTAFAVTVPDPPKVPPDDADHWDQWV
jgi:hypothetical protein